jgi:hypothetical protein
MKSAALILTLLITLGLPQSAFAWNWQPSPGGLKNPMLHLDLTQIITSHRAESFLQTRVLFKESIRQVLPGEMNRIPTSDSWLNPQPLEKLNNR